MKINKLALQAFYESRRDEYLRRRFSGDKALWDESYKWDILPRLNKELAACNTSNMTIRAQSLRGILLRSIKRSAAKKLESTTLRVAFQKMKEQTFKSQNILE